MPIELSRMVAGLDPERTVLLFGSGSSIPSRAPSVKQITQGLCKKFDIDESDYSLAEVAALAENKASRRAMITEVRSYFVGLQPTGGLPNLPLYPWKSIYTTNYDDLIEKCYYNKKKDVVVYSSNFDFTIHNKPTALKLFKLHGTLETDICDGHKSRMIISEQDYTLTFEYREKLYDRLKGDLTESQLVIIGHSLGDPHIKDIVDRATKLNTDSLGLYKIILLVYTRDDNRASLYERKGLEVCFGGIDDFFAALGKKVPKSETVFSSTGNIFDSVPDLYPVTIEVSHELGGRYNVNGMFNGWPATYADIAAGLTFPRDIAQVISTALNRDEILCGCLLGASGVGKTTAARQAVLGLSKGGYLAWEHKVDQTLCPQDWIAVAEILKEKSLKGVLFVDEAHKHLYQINELLDKLTYAGIMNLKILCVSTRNQWGPRIKSIAFGKIGSIFKLSKLSPSEIDALLNLVEINATIRPLVETSFSGFSRFERRRRLEDRCEADTFVCLKNIFATDKFDDIILREYANLEESYRDIYRIVSAMESSGIAVHRQLVIRYLGVDSETISSVLTHLTDIISEYPINEKEGIYGWKGRHSVISGIITKYKFNDISKLIELYDKVIDYISPTYDIEIRTIIELCSTETGIRRIPDKKIQNRMFRRLISTAPGARVPRHRLIRNLIDMGEFEEAEGEIRIFEKDFKSADGPISRYKAQLLITRAVRTPGIMDSDRLAILGHAHSLVKLSISKYPTYNILYSILCEIGFEIYKLSNNMDIFDEAMMELTQAEEKNGDPDLGKIRMKYQRKIAGEIIESIEGPEEIESL